MLQIKQQVLAAYEKGIRRIPALQLPPLAKTLRVSVEELLGVQSIPLKRGPNTKLKRRIDELKQLPASRQKLVLELVETVLKAEAKA